LTYDADLFVIGAGSGGVRAARIAAGHGARVIVAEDDRIGGTCVLRGCVPKKLLVYASRFADDFADAAGYGWRIGETNFDWPTLVAAKEREVSRLSGIYRANLETSGVTTIESRAEIAGPNGSPTAASCARVTSRSPPGPPPNARRRSPASNMRSPPTRFSTSTPSPTACSSSAAAISQSNSPPFSRGSAPPSPR
jgi:glutathione reductase (NADPH)